MACFDAPPRTPSDASDDFDVRAQDVPLDASLDSSLDARPDSPQDTTQDLLLEASSETGTDGAPDTDATSMDVDDVPIDLPLPPCGQGRLRCDGACIDVAANTTHCGRCGNTCLDTQTCRAGACVDDTPCLPLQQRCLGTCVDTTRDPTNCGACGNPCPRDRTCVDGACRTPPSCPHGLTACSGTCVDTASDPNHCGSCGRACSPGQSCRMGACGTYSPCPAGLTSCGKLCVDTQTNLAHCGTCDRACGAGQVCMGGTCRMMDCPIGQLRCGSTCVSTDTDRSNCGVCGRTCAPGQTCTAGTCTGPITCLTGQTRCGESCSDLRSDPLHCGMCNRPCSAGQTCQEGTCVAARSPCPMGQTDCAPTAPSPLCVNLATSNEHCGACNQPCPSGLTCVAGACTCPMGFILCGRNCVNPQSDDAHCGACGRPCNAGQTCQMGTCRCATGRTLCEGACVDTQSDESHCGTCGTVCPPEQRCLGGRCTCPPGQTRCGEGPEARCIDTRTDRAHCGACGRRCSTGQSCMAGVCTCAGGRTLCNETCVDTMTDANHCGMCNRACPPGQGCRAGACLGAPPANDTRAGATPIDLGPPTQTLLADTTMARNDTRGACGCTSGNDVFFRFTLTQPEIVYADTLGASWDTALFFQNALGANVAAAADEVTCNDDLSTTDLCPRDGLQSQVVARLSAGTWYLVLSGCGAGMARITFQHLPAGNGPARRIRPNATVQTVMGTTSGAGTLTGTCCTAGPEASHWWITCPDTPPRSFHATSCNGMTGLNQANYDNALVQYSALRGPAAQVCNDDTGGICEAGASLHTTIPSTGATQAGLNVLVADACAGAGPYTLHYILADCSTGTRCGSNCVDTSTDANHCGGCNRRCPSGNVCVDGTCLAPPSNDLPARAVVIDMTRPQSTFSVDTRAATNQTTGPCSCTAGRDVFYTFTIPPGPPELVYADTLGSTWDTSLFVQTSAGANVTNPGLPLHGVACNDDGGLFGCRTGLQSQILLLLNPGTYRLVVSGCGSGGTTAVRFQHLPVGNGPLVFLPAGSSTPSGSTSGAGRVNLGCNAGGPENTYYWYTCASSPAGTFSASTCGRASWDTSLTQYSPARSTPGAMVCNDDACPLSRPQQSFVVATIPAGAGIHALYIDGFGLASGAYTLAVQRP